MKYLSLIFILVSIACTQENATTLQEKPYFDLADFIAKQTSQLADNQPITEKMVSINGKIENITTKKIDWKKEFQLFSDADINKQAYQKSYDKIETPFSLIYTLKPTEDLPVKSLKITLDSLSKSPKQIECVLQVQNYLYNSDKHLEMTLQNGKVKEYKIENSQKLFWGSKKDFLIVGVIKK